MRECRFQCLIGCRVGDLYKMTKANVINGGIEYIPRKTKDGRPVTVRMPLNSIAKEILERYKDCPFDELLPLISQQKYNVAIKKMFLDAGLARPVVVYNPTTSEQEIRPLNEVASSHLARLCFVGNLYKQVKGRPQRPQRRQPRLRPLPRNRRGYEAGSGEYVGIELLG